MHRRQCAHRRQCRGAAGRSRRSHRRGSACTHPHTRERGVEAMLHRVTARSPWLRGAVFLAALLIACVDAAFAVTPANAGSPLGMNLNGVAYYSSEQPFMNVFVTNGGWITRGEHTWDTQ